MRTWTKVRITLTIISLLFRLNILWWWCFVPSRNHNCINTPLITYNVITVHSLWTMEHYRERETFQLLIFIYFFYLYNLLFNFPIVWFHCFECKQSFNDICLSRYDNKRNKISFTWAWYVACIVQRFWYNASHFACCLECLVIHWHWWILENYIFWHCIS